MNKDLAGVNAIWRALFGVRDRRFTACLMLSKSPRKWFLRRMIGPSLKTGAVFDAALSENCCAICDLVSVMGVQEKCDEKRQALARLAFGFRHFAALRELSMP